MTSFAREFLLESVVVPALVAGFLVFPTRWFSHRVSFSVVSAAAFSMAIAAAWLMIFGWPGSEVLGARQKIALLALITLLFGLAHGKNPKHLSRLLPVLSILGVLWIGWPALIQGHLTTILLVLPIGTGLWINRRIMAEENNTRDLYQTVIIMAIGLALTAFFARTLSMMELSLALAASLGAIALVGPKPPDRITLIGGTTMLIGLASALMLYSDVSLLALLILGCIPVIGPLLGILMNRKAINRRSWLSPLIAVVLTALSVSISWIDAGSISVY